MGISASAFVRGDGPIKALVLGCMQSGKSTFIRQMVKNATKNVCATREYYRYCLQLHLLNVYRDLRKMCENLDINYGELASEFETIDTYRHREYFNDNVINAINKLKRSGLFDLCKSRQRVLHMLPQNYNHFIQNTELFVDKNYVPTEMDILLSYSQTIGENRELLTCGSIKIELLEMPGHHIWRQKWAERFADQDMCIFVIDMSEICNPNFYDRGFLENKTLDIFKEVVNHPLLKGIYWVLIFNKMDIFEEHAAGFDFKKLASHLDTAESARNFYRSQFLPVVPKTKLFHHNLSLILHKESQTFIGDMFKKIGRLNRDRKQLT
ncbi:unnamed protein product [Caenorhabditis sp. 36 PRJEB53466]|nr:unnamed protein product [Caenorhabditis sp. 36 PRJEB53466]